jgi:hypothetical protein
VIFIETLGVALTYRVTTECSQLVERRPILIAEDNKCNWSNFEMNRLASSTRFFCLAYSSV